MARKSLCFSLLVAALLSCGGFVVIHRNFQDPRAWVTRSPVNDRWAVDLIKTGFQDTGMQFRAHDWRASFFRPVDIADLHWEERYEALELHWSKDGSVAAVTVRFAGGAHPLYGCAYDFLNHQALRTGEAGTPLVASRSLSAAVERLMLSRGGVRTPVALPDYKSLP